MKKFPSLFGILPAIIVISCSTLQTSHIQCPDLSSNSNKTKLIKSHILTLTKIKYHKKNEKNNKAQLTESTTSKSLFTEAIPSPLSNSLLTTYYKNSDVSFDKINFKIDIPPINSSNTSKDTTEKKQNFLPNIETHSEQNTENTYHKSPEEKDSGFTKNLLLGWLLTFASIALIFLAILALVVPVLTVFLLIAAMFVAFSAVEKSWDAITAKGAGPPRILAIPPLIVSAIISLLLLIIIGIISLLSD